MEFLFKVVAFEGFYSEFKDLEESVFLNFV